MREACLTICAFYSQMRTCRWRRWCLLVN